MKLKCADRFDSPIGSRLKHLITSQYKNNESCERESTYNKVCYCERDHRLQRLRITLRGHSCGVSCEPQAELHHQKSKSELRRTCQIFVLRMTPHQDKDRRDDQKRHHSTANDMRDDTEGLVSKARTQHKLDQHHTNGGSHQRANQPPVGIGFSLPRHNPASRNPASRSENAY